VLASSLLKLTSQTSVDHESDEATKKREEVAAKLMAGAPDGVLDVLDASLDYARCQAMYDHVVDDVERLLHRCETATLYLERLRKSLPVQQLMQLDLKEQEAVWAWCDLEEEWEQDGVCCFSIGNAGVTSDEYQLRSPPFYALGVPWTLRLYKAKAAPGQDACFMAAYLDAGNALRIDPTFEQEVTFTFALRKAADQKAPVMCRKEATFTFNKGADNRGWKECVPASQVEDGPLFFTVEVREGAVATENITITVSVEKHENCPTASFKVKPSTAMQRLMESYCSKHHFRPDKVKLKYLDKKTGSEKIVAPDQTPSDLGMSLEQEELVAIVKDDEVEAVMKRAGVGLLEAAEAMEKCTFQPRKALQMLDSQKRAREQAEKAETKLREQAEAEVASAKMKNRGEPEPKKKIIADELADVGSLSPASVEIRPESAFPSRHSIAAKEEEEEPALKSKKKGKKNENFGFEDLDSAGPKNLGVPDRNSTQNGDFGGRKVFIGGTADKDEAELRSHFAQAFGPVADVEVVRERDGSHRGFAFVTFKDKKHADMLKSQHHTNIGNVRMEARPCVPPRSVIPPFLFPLSPFPPCPGGHAQLSYIADMPVFWIMPTFGITPSPPPQSSFTPDCGWKSTIHKTCVFIVVHTAGLGVRDTNVEKAGGNFLWAR